MDTKRKSYTPEFKLKVVLESMQRDTTQEEVCKKFGISNSMIHCWKKEFQANAASIFHDKRDPKRDAHSQGYEPGESPDDSKKLIGELTVQNEILKKASGLLNALRDPQTPADTEVMFSDIFAHPAGRSHESA